MTDPAAIKKVSADTITDITVRHGFDSDAPKAPTAQKMIDDLRTRLKADVENLTRSAKTSRAAQTDPAAPPSAFEISLKRAQRALQDFEQLVGNVPKGFRLTPVRYSRINKGENAAAMAEFTRKVRRHFLKYLAEQHADELGALGICQGGINRMKKGLDPCNEKGQLYDISIDHIIERSGGGNMSLDKDIDPLMPEDSGVTYLINHFSNFILLPEQVHQAKNMLNELQDSSKTEFGKSRWILMLIPETGPGQSGFVAAPQNKGHYLAGLHRRSMDTLKKISHAEYIAGQAQELLDTLCKNPLVAAAVKTAEEVAARQHQSVASIVRDERSSKKDPQKKLSVIFNNAVAADPQQKDALDNFVRSAVVDAENFLKEAFDVASKPDANPKDYEAFVRFYRGKAVSALRHAIRDLPIEETASLHKTCWEINDQIEARQEQKKKNGYKP